MPSPVRVFVQARMSSRRFPGKVLVPLAGRPVVDRLLDAVCDVVPSDRVMVLTSDDPTDTPLCRHVEARGVASFRGALDDVFGRFRAALRKAPCERFVRLSADSPLLPAALLRRMLDETPVAADLVTNVKPRTFPKGWSVEVVRSAAFEAIDPALLTADDREHVTTFFYAHPDRYRIVNVSSADPAIASESFAVDTPDDLARLERLVAGGHVPSVAFA